MKRTPLKRTGSLRRKTPLRRKPFRDGGKPGIQSGPRETQKGAATPGQCQRDQERELAERYMAAGNVAESQFAQGRYPPRERPPSHLSKYRSRERDAPYMLWVKTLKCHAAHLSPCFGSVEADHAGRRPTGRKAPDNTCIPMCQRHHAQRDAFKGVFRTWVQDEMRGWLAATVVRYQALYQRLNGG